MTPTQPTAATPPTNYAVRGTYEGRPVIYNPFTDDLAYLGADGLAKMLPEHAEMLLRDQLNIPRTNIRQRLDQPTEFVTLSPVDEGQQPRRGEIVCATDRGVTLRVTAVGARQNDVPQIEMWPWGSIVKLVAERPDEQERMRLNPKRRVI